jgi:uncharacterized membrane protein
MTKLIVKALILTMVILAIVSLTLSFCTWLAGACGQRADNVISIIFGALSVIVIFCWSFIYVSAKEDNERKED